VALGVSWPSPAAGMCICGLITMMLAWPGLLTRSGDSGSGPLRWIEPPADSSAGWDAADADPDTIAKLIETARILPLSGGRANDGHANPTCQPGPRVVRIADVVRVPLEWLWPSRIPAGKLTILDGDPGLGKSTISIDLAARVSTGRPFPGETTGRAPAGVVLLSAEDGLADTIRPGVEAAGGDPARIVAMTEMVDSNGVGRQPSLRETSLISKPSSRRSARRS
jgi:hypothetical protein